ncbi:MAG: hypothetical protein ACK2UC_03035 [Anaerolineae bacterium]|jgi:hypothetical protein
MPAAFEHLGADCYDLELNDLLVGPGVAVDLSDTTGDDQADTPWRIARN